MLNLFAYKYNQSLTPSEYVMFFIALTKYLMETTKEGPTAQVGAPSSWSHSIHNQK